MKTYTLTEKQQEECLEWMRGWRDNVVNTAELDRARAEAVILRIYKKYVPDNPVPEFIHVASPIEAQKVIEEHGPSDKGDFSYLWGQHESFFPAVYTYLRDNVPEVEFTDEERETMELWTEAAQALYWWWPYENYCIVSDRPLASHFDEDGNLHCEDGPAMATRDGFEDYLIHNVRVPKHVVMAPETITAEEVRNEKQMDVRRIMIERMGLDKYFNESKAKLIDLDMNGNPAAGNARALYSLEGVNFHVLVGTDSSTSRVYHMFVPEDTRTCKDAHNAICGFDESKIVVES